MPLVLEMKQKKTVNGHDAFRRRKGLHNSITMQSNTYTINQDKALNTKMQLTINLSVQFPLRDLESVLRTN